MISNPIFVHVLCIVGWIGKIVVFVQKNAEIFGGVRDML